MDRIDPTLRAIFRAAAAEFLIKTPPKVVINEFVEIANSFFPDGKECKLANGVLDKLATQILSYDQKWLITLIQLPKFLDNGR